jgi:quercetin dioxygenase-like cupin family protein
VRDEAEHCGASDGVSLGGRRCRDAEGVTAGYEVVHVDELEELPMNQGEFVWRPVRRRLGITAFGTNAYTARAGQRVVEEHYEQDGHEEMYVVLRGRATFTLGDDLVDAPAGTIVFARPGTKRGAIASEDGTAVLAVGAKPGVVFEPSPWEDIFAAFSQAEQGEVQKARELITGAVERRPDQWQGHFNAACFEVLYGDKEAGNAHLQRAYELDPGRVSEAAAKDKDLDAVRNDPRVSAIAGQADASGSGA